MGVFTLLKLTKVTNQILFYPENLLLILTRKSTTFLTLLSSPSIIPFLCYSFIKIYKKSGTYIFSTFFTWTHYNQAFVPTPLKLLLSRPPVTLALLNPVVNAQSSYHFIYQQHLTQLIMFFPPSLAIYFVSFPGSSPFLWHLNVEVFQGCH